MSEAEWLAAKHPYDLIYHPKCRSDRKRRLFATACARRVLPFLSDPRFAEVVAGCEEFADSVIAWKGVLALRKVVRGAAKDLHAANGLEHQNHAAAAFSAITSKEFMSFKMAVEAATAAFASQARPDWDGGRDRETAAQIGLARDIFGNPFRPVTVSAAWRTDTASAVASQMYESRDFSAMPILADALQDAGCDNTAILDHCRDVNHPHVRGCWVVDMVLGKQ